MRSTHMERGSAMPLGKTRDEIAEAYKSEPWWYDIRGFFILCFAYNSTVGTQLRFFGRNMGKDHLEVACGTGTLLKMILKWRRRKRLPQANVVGIDYAPSMLAGAEKRFANDLDVRVEHADAAELPYADNSFDTANIANSIHCFPTVDNALRDIRRVLKPGGTLAANVLLFPRGVYPFNRFAAQINSWGMKKGILYSPFKLEEIQQTFKDAGYGIQSEFLSGNTWNVVAIKHR